MIRDIFFKNEAELVRYAKQFACVAPPNATLYLVGELGAGKTTFARGFLQGLGFDKLVKSPTYTLVEPYEVNEIKIYHFDLYRIADPEELSFLGIEEYFSEQALRLIEWPERGKNFLLPADVECTIYLQPVGRKMVLRACSVVGEEWLSKLGINNEKI